MRAGERETGACNCGGGLVFEYVMREWRVGQARVQLDHLALAHFLGDRGRILVKLPIPFTQSIDRPVASAQ